MTPAKVKEKPADNRSDNRSDHRKSPVDARRENLRKARAAIRDRHKAIDAANAVRLAKPPGQRRRENAAKKRKRGVIDRAKSYPKELFCQLTGMGTIAWRNALKTGLKVTQTSAGYWITGEAYWEWLRGQEEIQEV